MYLEQQQKKFLSKDSLLCSHLHQASTPRCQLSLRRKTLSIQPLRIRHRRFAVPSPSHHLRKFFATERLRLHQASTPKNQLSLRQRTMSVQPLRIRHRRFAVWNMPSPSYHLRKFFATERLRLHQASTPKNQLSLRRKTLSLQPLRIRHRRFAVWSPVQVTISVSFLPLNVSVCIKLQHPKIS